MKLTLRNDWPSKIPLVTSSSAKSGTPHKHLLLAGPALCRPSTDNCSCCDQVMAVPCPEHNISQPFSPSSGWRRLLFPLLLTPLVPGRGCHQCLIWGRVLNPHCLCVSFGWLIVVNLTYTGELESSWKRELKLRNCLYKIGLWACLRGHFL